MIALLVLVGILQATPEQTASGVQNAPPSCTSAQISRSRDDILKCRPEVEERATKIQAASPSASQNRDQALANAALELAKQEEAKGEESCQSEQQVVDYYQIAKESQKVDQQALAINNLASFYWRCQKADLAKKTMQSLPYEKLTTPTQMAFYLDNYAQLLTLTGDFTGAAANYKLALLNNPEDQASLIGLSGLFVQDKLPVPFITETADLLADKRQTRTAVDLVLLSLSSAKQSSGDDSRQFMLSLVHAYAAGNSTSVEFAKFDQSRLQQIVGSHKEIASLVQELNTAFLEKFRVDALPQTTPNQSAAGGNQNGSIVQQTSMPILPRVDHAISERFRAPERKVVEQLFPSWILAGGAHELSLVLRSVGEECTHTGDFSCAGHRYAAAWLLDNTNTAAAQQLAILYQAGSIPELNQWLTQSVADYYSPKHSVVKSLYKEPSQTPSADADNKESALYSQIYQMLTAKTATATDITAGSESSNPGIFAIDKPLRHGDIVLHGSAPKNVEAIYIAAYRSDKATCGTPKAMAQVSAIQKPTDIPNAGKVLPLQYAIVPTDGATGLYRVALRQILSRGDVVCVYQVVHGVPEGEPLREIVLAPPFFDLMRNYLAVGGYFGSSAGEMHFLPRVSISSDFSLARWGYDRYQDQSSHPYNPLTALVNVYEELRFTSIPKATVNQEGGSGITDVLSLEVGGYAPLFTHQMTWRYVDYERAFFVAPLVRGGIDYFPGHGSEDALAAGARLGVLRLAPSSRFNAPELQSYLDIVYGNSTNLFVDALERTHRLHQVGFNGMLKIPETPFYIGFNTTAGPGAKQTGIFLGARFEMSRLLQGKTR